MFLYFLSLIAPPGDLGAFQWAEREAAEARCVAAWPLSRPLLLAAQKSADPETRDRALRADARGADRAAGPGGGPGLLAVLNRPAALKRMPWLAAVQPSLVRGPMLDFACGDAKREHALWLILAPFPDADGLPWVPEAVHKAVAGDAELAGALCALVNHTWVGEDGDRILLACDPALKEVAGFGPWKGRMLGLDNARFWLRGLGDPQNYHRDGYPKKARAVWLQRKAAVPETRSPTPPGGAK